MSFTPCSLTASCFSPTYLGHLNSLDTSIFQPHTHSRMSSANCTDVPEKEVLVCVENGETYYVSLVLPPVMVR